MRGIVLFVALAAIASARTGSADETAASSKETPNVIKSGGVRYQFPVSLPSRDEILSRLPDGTEFNDRTRITCSLTSFHEESKRNFPLAGPAHLRHATFSCKITNVSVAGKASSEPITVNLNWDTLGRSSLAE